MKAIIQDSRGSVLIMVAWIFAIMGIIAAFLLYRSELEWAAVVNLERNTRARQLAEEVLQERLALLRNDDTENDCITDLWFEEDGYFQDRRDGYQITVIIEDESSKPNLNLLDQSELESMGLAGEEADALLDWIDIDSDLSPEGAEADYYQSLTPVYKPRDGFLSALREVLAVKGGQEIYQKIAPYCTVFGKYNINTLSEKNLENLLLSAGFEKSWTERMVSDVKNYRSTKVFTDYDELRQLSAVSLDKLDELRPLLTLTGIINLNFISENGLAMILKKNGYNQDLAGTIIRYRREQPFAAIEEAQHYFNTREKPLKAGLYFTTVSTIIRYQIWLTKGKHTYYLETIQERIPEKGANKWRTLPISRCFLINREVPELPAPPIVPEDSEDEDG